MDDANSTESPLEAAAGAAGSHVTDAFELLSHEVRLSILLALWEAYDPYGTNEPVPFSELFDRVAVRDSGNFTFHLDKLTDHFVKRTDDGYELRNAGHKIVQAVISGAGLEERTLPPTEIDMSCYRCGDPVELTYENERLYLICTECEGNVGPNSSVPSSTGTIMAHSFNPAGLAHRTPGEVFVAGTIELFQNIELCIRGVCPRCSGPVDSSMLICERHETVPDEGCPNCGTPHEVRVRYICSVCKHRETYPAQAAVHGHPAIVAFCYEHGIERTFDLDDPEACGRLWSGPLQKEHTLVSEDPIRVRISLPGDGETLHVTIDGDLDVIDVTRSND